MPLKRIRCWKDKYVAVLEEFPLTIRTYRASEFSRDFGSECLQQMCCGFPVVLRVPLTRKNRTNAANPLGYLRQSAQQVQYSFFGHQSTQKEQRPASRTLVLCCRIFEEVRNSIWNDADSRRWHDVFEGILDLPS